MSFILLKVSLFTSEDCWAHGDIALSPFFIHHSHGHCKTPTCEDGLVLMCWFVSGFYTTLAQSWYLQQNGAKSTSPYLSEILGSALCFRAFFLKWGKNSRFLLPLPASHLLEEMFIPTSAAHWASACVCSQKIPRPFIPPRSCPQELYTEKHLFYGSSNQSVNLLNLVNSWEFSGYGYRCYCNHSEDLRQMGKGFCGYLEATPRHGFKDLWHLSWAWSPVS